MKKLERQIIEINGIQYDYHKSPNNMIIQRDDGQQFGEAIDPLNCGREYYETDIPIEEPENIEPQSDEDYIQAAKILMGED